LSPVTSPSKQHQTTSSFKNSGREKSLLTNGKYYETLREEKTMSNIGPGMYDVSPYPSYMGQQLINPTIIDYRYRQHSQGRHGHGSRSEERKERTKRLSMNDILLGGNKTAAVASSSSTHRPHTTTGTLSMTGGTGTGTGGGMSNGRMGIKDKQLLTERKNEIENVQKLPEYPQRSFPQRK
jgi:hypothetical protein